jgi:hypothetical protein
MAVAGAAPASAQTELANDSPFLPAAGAAGGAAPAPSEEFELAGASVAGTQVRVCICDTEKKSSRWMAIGETAGPIQVLAYDRGKEEAVVRVRGVRKTLALLKVTVAASAQPAPVILPLGFAAPAVPVSPPLNLGQSAERKKQDEDARMLVSDLMDIGIRQRKAYEEARAKAEAAEKAGGQPGGLRPQP